MYRRKQKLVRQPLESMRQNDLFTDDEAGDCSWPSIFGQCQFYNPNTILFLLENCDIMVYFGANDAPG